MIETVARKRNAQPVSSIAGPGAFGQLLSGDPAKTRYLYTSREYDADTGTQYNRARWYDSGTGRWLSEDPIGFAGDRSNLYRYVGNGVTYRTDPSGLLFGIDGIDYVSLVLIFQWGADSLPWVANSWLTSLMNAATLTPLVRSDPTVQARIEYWMNQEAAIARGKPPGVYTFSHKGNILFSSTVAGAILNKSTLTLLPAARRMSRAVNVCYKRR